MERIVLVWKTTRLAQLELLYHTVGSAGFALESCGQSIAPYVSEDGTYQAAIDQIKRQIPSDIPITTVERDELPNFLFRPSDLIIVCGPDGLFANLAQYVDTQPILSVNPDPKAVAGVLMLFRPDEVRHQVERVQMGKHKLQKLPFAKGSFEDGRVIWAINDIFVGRLDHVSARYQLEFARGSEQQSSSGIIVSTGVGSTGWMRSIVAMLNGIMGEVVVSRLDNLPGPDKQELVFTVREPFPSPSTGSSIVTGRVVPGRPLVVTSCMPTGGFVFSDGMIDRALEWNAGSTLTITVGDRYVHRIIR
jgi:hypothetical protein